MAWNSYADGSWLNLNSLAIYRQENQPCRRLTNKIPGVWLGKKAADQLVPLAGEIPERRADEEADGAGGVYGHNPALDSLTTHLPARDRAHDPVRQHPKVPFNPAIAKELNLSHGLRKR